MKSLLTFPNEPGGRPSLFTDGPHPAWLAIVTFLITTFLPDVGPADGTVRGLPRGFAGSFLSGSFPTPPASLLVFNVTFGVCITFFK